MTLTRHAALAAALALALGSHARAAGAPPSPPAGKPAAAPKPASPAETDKTLYGLGVVISNNLETFDLSAAELDTVLRGLREGWAGKAKTKVDPQLQQALNDLARARAPRAMEKAAAREKEVGATYLAKASKEKGARKTPSGAIVITEKEGTGPSPTAADKVKVNYTGTLVSGQVFDSNQNRAPAEFALGGVIKCWTEGLQLMKAGGKAKFVCPPDTAYGPSGGMGIPGNAVLTFEVELVEVVKP
jgi:FKBP-type peptidyl-prolyl cis-trans isomerase